MAWQAHWRVVAVAPIWVAMRGPGRGAPARRGGGRGRRRGWGTPAPGVAGVRRGPGSSRGRSVLASGGSASVGVATQREGTRHGQDVEGKAGVIRRRSDSGIRSRWPREPPTPHRRSGHRCGHARQRPCPLRAVGPARTAASPTIAPPRSRHPLTEVGGRRVSPAGDTPLPLSSPTDSRARRRARLRPPAPTSRGDWMGCCAASPR